jgi:hypothetical protein
MSVAAAEFIYRLPYRTGSTRPGAHRSSSRGAGMNFVSHARLLDQPDPRRLDLRASIGNIRKEWLVRVNQQRAAITVSAIADVSPSMHFGSPRSKLTVVADFLAALGYSAGRFGDAVGLFAFDQTAREDLHIPARFGRGVGQLMAESIQTCRPSRSSGSASFEALSHCVERTAGNSALVFIASDFHWPLDQLERVLDPLAGALIVPLVIWDRAEIQPPESRRWLSVQQMGSRATRDVWLTPRVRQQWRDKVAQRRQEVAEVFASRNVQPFYVAEGFDPEALSQYFLETQF